LKAAIDPAVPQPLQNQDYRLSVLSNRNLQLYFGGQIISMLGTWMQQMALSWLIYRMTNSSFVLGLVGFASQAPSLLCTPFAGIVADRVNRHRLVITTQTLAMLQAGLLAALVFTGHAQLWQLIAFSAVLGIITAFDLPARQTFLFDMLESKEQLPAAIATNSSITTLTRLVGPFIAGLLIAWAGEGMCFLINAVSYIAVVTALLFVKAKKHQESDHKQDAFTQLKEGFAYAFGFPPIRSLLTLLALIGLFSMPFNVLMPAFAKDVFHGNASTLGFLTASSGLGAVIGAIFIGSRKGVQQLGNCIVLGCTLFGVGLVAFGSSKSMILSLCMLTITGFGSMVMLAGSNTLIQTIVDQDKRGRVMSIFVMAFLGLAPFGSMAAGALASRIGPGNTVIVLGIYTVFLAFAFRSRIEQIHREVA
jgi:MFS family permease